jgi:hypothetical protein
MKIYDVPRRRVLASFDFRAATNSAAGCMLTVTLTNDLDGTVYA